MGNKMDKRKKNELRKLKPLIVKILKKNGIKKAGVFGSYARGDQKKNSDIDILIQPVKGMSLFDVVGIELELKEVLGRRVDLLTYKCISSHLKKYIINDEVKLI